MASPLTNCSDCKHECMMEEPECPFFEQMEMIWESILVHPDQLEQWTAAGYTIIYTDNVTISGEYFSPWLKDWSGTKN